MNQPPNEPASKHKVKGYTFDDLCKIADKHDFCLEYNPSDLEGNGDEYELFSNKYALGVVGVYETLAEAANDVLELGEGRNPLAEVPLPSYYSHEAHGTDPLTEFTNQGGTIPDEDL